MRLESLFETGPVQRRPLSRIGIEAVDSVFLRPRVMPQRVDSASGDRHCGIAQADLPRPQLLAGDRPTTLRGDPIAIGATPLGPLGCLALGPGRPAEA